LCYVCSGITEKDTSFFQNTSFNGSFSGDLDTSTGGLSVGPSPSRGMGGEDRATMSFSTDVDSSTASAEDTKDLMASPKVGTTMFSLHYDTILYCKKNRHLYNNQ